MGDWWDEEVIEWRRGGWEGGAGDDCCWKLLASTPSGMRPTASGPFIESTRVHTRVKIDVYFLRLSLAKHPGHCVGL